MTSGPSNSRTQDSARVRTPPPQSLGTSSVPMVRQRSSGAASPPPTRVRVHDHRPDTAELARQLQLLRNFLSYVRSENWATLAQRLDLLQVQQRSPQSDEFARAWAD